MRLFLAFVLAAAVGSSAVAADKPDPAALAKRIDHHIGNAIASSFLGPAYSPFIFDPTQSRDDVTRMLTPQIELPSLERDALITAYQIHSADVVVAEAPWSHDARPRADAIRFADHAPADHPRAAE